MAKRIYLERNSTASVRAARLSGAGVGSMEPTFYTREGATVEALAALRAAFPSG